MRNRQVTVKIDPELCIGCGLCIKTCPKQTLALVDGKAVVKGNESMNCGHCAAACPTGAVKVEGTDSNALDLRTLSVKDRWIKPGQTDASLVVALMRSRRSCRNFRPQGVDPRILEDLARIGITAPSGSNCQPWVFAMLRDRKAVTCLAGKIAAFYRRLNRLASRAWIREPLAWLGKTELKSYFRQHLKTVQEALDQWEITGKDPLFHGAPAAMVIAADNDASCPGQDCLLAAANIMLAAHCMGLGTCLIGFAVEAICRDNQIHRWLGFNEDQSVHAVIALGWPDETYQRFAERMTPRIHNVQP